MNKGLTFMAALIVLVLAVVGWQASSEGESVASAREDVASARKEAEAQSQEASPEPEAGSTYDGSEASTPDGPAGTTQTKRLAVENILQVGGFGCVSCQTVVAGTLKKADGVEGVTYEPETDTYLVTVNDDFGMDEVAEKIRSISTEYNRRLGLPDSPDWILKEV